MIDINDNIPAVALIDSDGEVVDTGTLPTPFVLYFYPKADTPGCTYEAKDFSVLANDFVGLGCAIYGVSKDKPAKLAKFKAKYDLTVTLLSDEASDLTEQLGAWIQKSMYGRSYMGIERVTYLIGGDRQVARVWHKVKVKGHAQEVLAAASSL